MPRKIKTVIVSEQAYRYGDLQYRVDMTRDPSCKFEWIARHPELGTGCMACGRTRHEAIGRLVELRYEYIQLLLDDGAMIPLPTPQVTKHQDLSLRGEK